MSDDVLFDCLCLFVPDDVNRCSLLYIEDATEWMVLRSVQVYASMPK